MEDVSESFDRVGRIESLEVLVDDPGVGLDEELLEEGFPALETFSKRS